MSNLPVLSYNRYEETAFDSVPILEGVVNGEVVFGVLSLARADGAGDVNPDTAYHGGGIKVQANIVSGTGVTVEGAAVVISHEKAFQRVKSDHLAAYLERRRHVLKDGGYAKAFEGLNKKTHAIPAQQPKPVLPEPKPEPKPAPVVPDSPITMKELLLQIAAMQMDFDLRMSVVTKRLVALEAK